MNQISRILLLIIVSFAGFLTAHAVPDYPTLQGKASRFYANKEWTSALAMYELMLEQKPKELPVYAHAIVACGMIKDHELQFKFMERTEKVGLALDSVFNYVRNESFALSHPEVYEKFLILLKSRQNWLVRNVNTQLLYYYTFRSDADNMIAMAEMLLKSTPDNILYLQTMGDAYCLKGDLATGMKWYKKVLEYEPHNYNALITLGNYYNIIVRNKLKYFTNELSKMPNPTEISINLLTSEDQTFIKQNANEAIAYLAEAYAIIPTPYISKMLDNLRSITTPTHKRKAK